MGSTNRSEEKPATCWKKKHEDYGSHAVFSVNVRLVLAEFGDIRKKKQRKKRAMVDSSSVAAEMMSADHRLLLVTRQAWSLMSQQTVQTLPIDAIFA